MSEQDTSASAVEEPTTKHRGGIRDLASRLYQGDAGVDVVGKRKIFYGVAAAPAFTNSRLRLDRQRI